ncbi:MAG: peptide/nickel transport system substrate-binding protein [Thermomicrobiales bacterium]|nr:peptide/nickel transport system substrate-binding protein [Thermomicrobiales bacterium]
MSQDEFATLLLDNRLNRRDLIRRLTALGLAAPVAASIAMHVAPVAAAPAQVVMRRSLAQEATDGTLIVGTETDIEGFDPGHAGALATTRVISNVIEGLVKYSPGTVDLEPLLATEVPSLENGGISADGLSYTFKLRQGVTFHDGTPFNAEAVKTSYQRLYDKSFAHYDKTNTSGFFLAGLTTVDVVDEYTVKFTLGAPNSAFMELSNIYAGRVLSPKGIQEVAAAQWAEGDYGTGPFTVKSWEKGVKVELERNENYWGTKPALKTLIFRPIPEPTARVSALLNGEVDMIVVVPPDSIEQVKADANLTYEQGPSLHYWFIQLNTKAKPFDDVRVRQAVNYAVDKEGLANDILQGSAVPATQPMPAANWSYNPDVAGYPYDAEKAKSLLAEAGLADGFKTKMIIPQSGSGMIIPVQMNEYIQGNLADVGIDVEIQSFEWVSYLGIWAKGLTEEITMGNQSIMASDPYVANFLLSGGFTPADGGWNIGYYANPDVDKLLSDALAIADKEQRKQLYYQAWAKITEDAPWIFVVNDLQPMAFKTKVKGYVTNPAYVIDFTTISIEE